MSKPSASLAIDIGPSWLRRETRRSRVSSPSAANTGAAPMNAAFAFLELRVVRKILLDQRHLYRPSTLVRRERLGAPLERDAIEARFGDGEQRAVRDFLEREGDERRRFGRVVDAPLDRERMPPEREDPLGLDPVDRDLERDVLVVPLHLRPVGVDGGPDQ